MPDAFFVSQKARKRKRSSGNDVSESSSSKFQKSFKGSRSSTSAFQKSRGQANGVGKGSKSKSKPRDEEIESDVTPEDDFNDVDDLDLRASDVDPNASGSDDEDGLETAAEKRLRLAKLYLQSVKEGIAAEEGEVDAAQIDKEIIASRLRQDVLEHAGKLHKFIAESLDLSTPAPSLRTRGHRNPVTCSVPSSCGKFLFSTGKDGCIAKWDLLTGKQLSYVHKRVRDSSQKSKKGKGKQRAGDASAERQAHFDEVWCLAVSDDGKTLASGGRDRRLLVWDAETMEGKRSFGGHKDSLTSLTFRKGSSQVYTASLDRTLKLFDLSPDVMGYIETFFGHQDGALWIDALRNETAVSCGGRDKTCRFWKVVDETQLVFRGGGGSSKLREVMEGMGEGMDLDGDGDDDAGKGKKGKRGKDEEKQRFIEGSIDCVALVDESTFVSGGDSGSLCVWSTQKKKPVFTVPLAHGLDEMMSATEGLIETPRWITSLASLRYSDTIASGSWCGDIRLWRLEPNAKDPTNPASKPKPFVLSQIGSLSAPGFVNSLQLISVPRATVEQYTWTQRRDGDQNGKAAGVSEGGSVVQKDEEVKRGAESVLVVAGMGQEPRLGRWKRIKEGGANNGTRVFMLPMHPKERRRTTSTSA